MSESIPFTGGMMVFRVRHRETGETYDYECADANCARLLAAGEYGGEPEDYEIMDD